MKPLYKIRDWDRHYENSESRKIKTARFVLVPVKHDGKGYRRVVAHGRRAELLGAWMVIVQVAAKMPVRGTLADEDGPLTSEDLHYITGLPEELFQLAFSVFCSDGIRWMETENLPEHPGVSRNIPESPGTSRSLPEHPGTPGNAGVEGKGTEQKGTEGNVGADKPPGSPKKRTKKKFDAARCDLPENLLTARFRSAWEKWIVARRERRWPTSENWAQGQLEKLSAYGAEIATLAVEDSAVNYWQGVFPEKKKYAERDDKQKPSGLDSLREGSDEITARAIDPQRIRGPDGTAERGGG